MQPHGGPIEKQPIPGVRHVVAVASGKGGVGKSTVAVQPRGGARAQRGYRIGLMDADIYGPSLPMMMKRERRALRRRRQEIVPLERTA